jgi:hypothetical protein
LTLVDGFVSPPCLGPVAASSRLRAAPGRWVGVVFHPMACPAVCDLGVGVGVGVERGMERVHGLSKPLLRDVTVIDAHAGHPPRMTQGSRCLRWLVRKP